MYVNLSWHFVIINCIFTYVFMLFITINKQNIVYWIIKDMKQGMLCGNK